MKIQGVRNHFMIKEFYLLYHTWENDNEGWLVQFTDGSKGIILTNDGVPYEGTTIELEEKIEEYTKLIEEYKDILKELHK